MAGWLWYVLHLCHSATDHRALAALKFIYGGKQKKSVGAAGRPFTTGLFLLRCTQMGLSMSDLNDLDVGMVYDMMIELANDSAEDTQDTVREATQADFDKF